MCNHHSCGDKEKVWLPYKYNDLDCGLKPHLYCTQCGIVKIASSDKPRRLGYYINVVAAIGQEFKVTKVQMRLIALELQRLQIDDIYSIDGCHQEKLFIEAVRKYVNVSEQNIRKFF
jgi:hypothetical protein